MTTDFTERVFIISSAKVTPIHDIEFRCPRLVGGYNWIESEDGDDEPTIAVPGEIPVPRLLQMLMAGLPDVWTGDTGRSGQLKPDVQIPGYLEYADRKFPFSLTKTQVADEKIMAQDLLEISREPNPSFTLLIPLPTCTASSSSLIEIPFEKSTASTPPTRYTVKNRSGLMLRRLVMSSYSRDGRIPKRHDLKRLILSVFPNHLNWSL